MKALLVAASLLASGAAGATPVAAPGADIAVEDRDYNFSYSYPAAAGSIPALKAWLDKDAAKQREAIVEEVRAGQEAAKETGLPFSPYDSSVEWKVVTDLPGWLSLSGSSGQYTGGAHPNHGPTALLWDKARNREVKAIDLFASKEALSAAIRAPFCAELNRQRAKKRGEPVDAKSTDPFDACLDPADSVVILGSADHAHFTRIGILLGPYAAGAYVEGDYEVTLPVTPPVLSAVRPEYRNAFALAPATKANK
jgi:hypothetical protein